MSLLSRQGRDDGNKPRSYFRKLFDNNHQPFGPGLGPAYCILYGGSRNHRVAARLTTADITVFGDRSPLQSRHDIASLSMNEAVISVSGGYTTEKSLCTGHLSLSSI